ncbi:hypothetical protein ACQ86G_26020 [Roseateles chitinivorans]|uniref:hypothetical protein n=1 Tax=Roseateles chitinivorans TaxID=2917965 RepID=UPI003D671E25
MLADDQPIALDGLPELMLYGDTTPTSGVVYCAATRPALARIDGVPQLRLLTYDRPLGNDPDADAGQLSMVVDLRPDDALLARARDALTLQRGGLAPELRPIPWTAGEVVARLTGQAPRRARPSLLGDNSVALTLGLGVRHLAMLGGGDAGRDAFAAQALAVVYALRFDAFREAWRIDVQVDGSKFRRWVQERCALKLPFLEIEHVQTFETLRASGAIRVDTTDRGGLPLPDGFRLAFMRSVRNALTPMPRFATPGDGETGGWSLGIDCSRLEDEQTLVRKLDMRMSVSGMVSRQACPLGAPTGLAEALRDCRMETIGTGRSYVRPLRVRCHDDYRGPVRAVELRLDPPEGTPGGSQAHVFNADRPQDWPTSLSRTATAPRARCVVHFQDGGGLDRPASLERPLALDTDQAFLDIVPAGLFADRRFSIEVAEAFPWPLVRSVEVRLAGAGLRWWPPSVELDERRPGAVIEAFAPQPVDFGDVRCELVVHPASGDAALRLPGGQPAGGVVFVNPFARRDVGLRIDPGIDWGGRDSLALRVVPGPLQLWPETVFTLHRDPDVPPPVLRYWHAGDRGFALAIGGVPPRLLPADAPPLVALPFHLPTGDHP